MRKITTSLNIDPLHLAWLKSQKGGMAKYIHDHVELQMRAEEGVTKVEPENKELVAIKGKIEKFKEIETEKTKRDEERVRHLLRNKPGQLANIKRDPTSIVTKSWLTTFQGVVLYDNPDAKVSINRIRAILKEEVESFDEKAYLASKAAKEGKL